MVTSLLLMAQLYPLYCDKTCTKPLLTAMQTKNPSSQPHSNALFPIGTVSEQTGVNTVTLRAWERRYGLLKPQRTPKGHRLYSMEDVERVKKVLLLLEQGIPVSRVRHVLDQYGTATLPSTTAPPTDDPWQHYRQQFLHCIHKLDTSTLEHTFNEASALYPLELLAKKLLKPLYQQLAQQRALLPTTSADFTFLHEFLCARLGSLYLQHNSHANGKRLLLANTHSAEKQVETLLLAAGLSQHGYVISLLGAETRIDHLPLVLQRTHFDAVLIIGDGQHCATLEALATLRPLPLFISPPTTNPLAQTHLHTLPDTLTEMVVLLAHTLGTT